MSVTSDTAIANLALTAFLGHVPISDLATDTTKEGRIMRTLYEPTRDLMLRSHPWNFAVKRQTLAASTSQPNHGYLYAFPIPTDCLKIINTDFEAATTVYFGIDVGQYTLPQSYRVEVVNGQRCIVTDESSCRIEYIARIQDVTFFDPLFVDVLASRLAAQAAYPITQSRAVARDMWEQFQLRWVEATGTDAQEGTPRNPIVDQWIGARY